MKNLRTKKSQLFLEKYLNNSSPTGFESEGQKIWLDYIRPNIDDYFTDNYGSAVGVINPNIIPIDVVFPHPLGPRRPNV